MAKRLTQKIMTQYKKASPLMTCTSPKDYRSSFHAASLTSLSDDVFTDGHYTQYSPSTPLNPSSVSSLFDAMTHDLQQYSLTSHPEFEYFGCTKSLLVANDYIIDKTDRARFTHLRRRKASSISDIHGNEICLRGTSYDALMQYPTEATAASVCAYIYQQSHISCVLDLTNIYKDLYDSCRHPHGPQRLISDCWYPNKVSHTRSYGNFHLSCESVDVSLKHQGFMIYHLCYSRSDQHGKPLPTTQKYIKHYHYLYWPTHSSPGYFSNAQPKPESEKQLAIRSFITGLDHLRTTLGSDRLVVHCVDGMTRSLSALIALKTIQSYRDGHLVSHRDIVEMMWMGRLQRDPEYCIHHENVVQFLFDCHAYLDTTGL